jgi:hypothetical protein
MPIAIVADGQTSPSCARVSCISTVSTIARRRGLIAARFLALACPCRAQDSAGSDEHCHRAAALRCLVRDGKLRPWHAFAASLFFVLPPPAPASRLLASNGGNVEPLLYTLILWLTRAHRSCSAWWRSSTGPSRIHEYALSRSF